MKRLMMVVLVMASLLMLTIGSAYAGPSPEAIQQLKADGAVAYFNTDDGKMPPEFKTINGWVNLSITLIIATGSELSVRASGYILTTTQAMAADICLVSYGNGKSFWVYAVNGTVTKFALNDY